MSLGEPEPAATAEGSRAYPLTAVDGDDLADPGILEAFRLCGGELLGAAVWYQGRAQAEAQLGEAGAGELDWVLWGRGLGNWVENACLTGE